MSGGSRGTPDGQREEDAIRGEVLELPRPLTATGPLGCCYQCVIARQKDPARPVAQAITLAPSAVQIGDAIGQVIGVQMVALPHCQACLTGTSSRLIT